MLKISVEGTLWAGNQLRLPVFGSLTMFWDVGKSRDGDLSEIENFVRKKGAQQTSPTMGPERKKERKTKECGKVQIVSTKINAWEFMT